MIQPRLHVRHRFKVKSIKASKLPLSPAELRIVREVSAGRTNEEIARRLGKGLGTVKNQLSSAYRKLGVGSRVQLVLRCGRCVAG